MGCKELDMTEWLNWRLSLAYLQGRKWSWGVNCKWWGKVNSRIWLQAQREPWWICQWLEAFHVPKERPWECCKDRWLLQPTLKSQDPKIFLHYHFCYSSSKVNLSPYPGSKTVQSSVGSEMQEREEEVELFWVQERRSHTGTSLVVWWLRLQAPSAGGVQVWSLIRELEPTCWN